MKKIIDDELNKLAESGNLRALPCDISGDADLVDLSSNDYLGLSSRQDLKEEFFAKFNMNDFCMSACSSRLLASRQKSFYNLESSIEEAFGSSKKALIFNSGYHANVGIVSAIGTTDVHILADKLVHASIIDGIRLSRASFERFRHNDISHLADLAHKAFLTGKKILIIAESVYSMDGDSAPIKSLVEIKNSIPGAMLYIDEAHALGVEGPGGLGLVAKAGLTEDVDILVGTFGKALSSVGAFALCSKELKDYFINRARSFIFSTALPPINIDWTQFVFLKSLEMDTERAKLKELCSTLSSILYPFGGSGVPQHIAPLIIGNPLKAVEISARLRQDGFLALPIRRPTVPPGTDRIRFSLSAAIDKEHLYKLQQSLSRILNA